MTHSQAPLIHSTQFAFILFYGFFQQFAELGDFLRGVVRALHEVREEWSEFPLVDEIEDLPASSIRLAAGRGSAHCSGDDPTGGERAVHEHR